MRIRQSSVHIIALACICVALSSDGAAQTLPRGATATNIGGPALGGSASYNGSTFTVTGAGKDIWGSSDQFMFVHATVTGDVTIVARVDSVQNVDPWTKAGLMIRESLASGARNGFALVSPGRGVAFQRRSSSSGNTASTITSGTAPEWLRLQRSGSSVTASRSSDGVTWTTIGTNIVSMSSTVYVGLAVTSHDAGARATAKFSAVSITKGTSGGSGGSTALPSGWTSLDIGGGPSGTARYGSGVFTIDAAGRDIWSTSDQFRYTYRQVSGDLDLIARVRSVEHVDDWTKAGVMIRGSLSASASHASMFVSASNGLAFQRRPSSGGTSVHTGAGSQAAPRWVGLTRRGSTINAFQSADGVNWTKVGTQTLTLPSSFYVGLAVTSHSTSSSLATAAFDNVGVRLVSGPSSNQPPAVTLTAPASGASYTAPATVSFTATASDGDGTIGRVDFYAGSTLVGSDSSSPYAYTWSGVAAGSYSLTAVARDNSGAATRSSARAISVSAPGNQSPVVSLSAPANGATFTAPASITISATASDADGTIARVDFYRGTTLIASDSTAPYSVTWNNAPAGSYSLAAVARDNDGATTVSAARSIQVRNPTVPGHAVFVPSSNHATAVDRYVIEFFTAGADPSVSNPIETVDVGKPPIVDGVCSTDVSQAVAGLAPGVYIATVTAIGPGGSARSAPSPQFTR